MSRPKEKTETLLLKLTPRFKGRLKLASLHLGEDMTALVCEAWEKELAYLERNNPKLATALTRMEKHRSATGA